MSRFVQYAYRKPPPAFAVRHIVYCVALACCELAAAAQPTGPTVVTGTAPMQGVGTSHLTVTNSPGAIINWQGFSIAAGNTTQFVQQSASSAVLNRVVGADISRINGSLLSNGRVFLINPAGILIGAGAVIDTAGFVGSTLNMQNADFLAGKLKFQAEGSAGSIANDGKIFARHGGDIVLIAPQIENGVSGVIKSEGGELILAAGQKLTVASARLEGVQFEVQAPGDSVVNLGQLIADGGAIGVFAGTLKHSGDIRASGITRDEGGRVVLKGKEDVTLTAGSSVKADGKSGGAITVQSVSGTTRVAGEVGATGREGPGGDIRILGDRVAVVAPGVIDASGASGGGQILVGGDFQGRNREVMNASRVLIGTNATLRADALDAGDGGKVIVWADGDTAFHGAISARGGARGGDGGFVETSGKTGLTVGVAQVDTRAPAGRTGTWLLDPHDIIVDSPSAATLAQVDQFSDTPATDITITPATIQAAGASVVLQANNDILINQDITISNAGVNFTAQAGRTIRFDDAIITMSNNGNVTFVANETAANGVIGAQRDAGPGGIDMNSVAGINAGTGNVSITVNTGLAAGSGGDITLSNVTGRNITVTDNSLTAGTGIRAANPASTLTSNNAAGVGEIRLTAREIGVLAGNPISVARNGGQVIAQTTAGAMHLRDATNMLQTSGYQLLVPSGQTLRLTAAASEPSEIIVDDDLNLPGVVVQLVPGAITTQRVRFRNGAVVTAQSVAASGQTTIFDNGGATINANLTTPTVEFQNGTVNLNGATNTFGGLSASFSGATVNVNGATANNFNAPVTISGGAANFNGPSTIAGAAGNRLTVSGGTLGGTNTLTVAAAGNTLWSGGGMTGNGTTVINGTLTMNGAAKTFGQRTLTVTGATTWSAGNVTNVAGGVFNANGGIDVQNNVQWTGTSGIPTVFNIPFGQSLTRTLGAPGDAAALDLAVLNNAGTLTLTANTGLLRLSGPGVSTANTGQQNGNTTLNAGTTLEIGGGAYQSIQQIAGTGTFLVSGGQAALVGPVTVSTLNVTGGLAFVNVNPIAPGVLNVSGGQFDVFSPVSTGGGSLSGSGTLRIFNPGNPFTLTGGTFDWRGGTLMGGGTFTVNAPATLTITQNNAHTLADGPRLVNNGIVTWTGSGAIQGVSGASEIQNNGTWNANNNSNMVAVAPGTLSFVNTPGANFAKGGGAGDTVGFDGVPFTQDGGLTVNAGTLNLVGGGTSAQPFTVNAGTLQFGGGTFNVNNTITGAGNLTVSGGALNANGLVTTTGAFSVTGGTATLNANATPFAPSSITVSGAGQAIFNRVVNNAGAFNISGGVAEFNSASTVGGAASAISGGIVRGTGLLTLNAPLALTGGTIATTGGGALDVNNTTTVSAGNPQLSGFLDTNVFNQTGGTLDILGTGTLFLADSLASSVTAGTLNNAGILRAAGLGGLTFSGASVLTNSGTLDAQGATIVYGGGTQTFNAGSAFNGIAGGNRVTTSAAFNGGITSQNLTLAAGTFTGTAAVLNGATAWEGGSMGGAFQVPNAATLSLNGAGIKTLDGGTLTTAGTGTIALVGTGNLVMNNAAGLTIANGGTLDFRSNANVTGGGVGVPSTLSNQGTIAKTVTLGNSTIGGADPLNFTNEGILTAAGGMTLNYAATNAFNAGTQFTGAGAHTVNGNSTFTGVIPVTNFTLASGIFGGTASLNGDLDWSGGTITGVFTVPNATTLHLIGTTAKTMTAGSLTTAGTGTIAILDTGGLILNDGSTLTIAANGTFDFRNNAPVSGGFGAPSTFTNAGTLSKTVIAGTSAIGNANPFDFINSGVLTAAAGTTLNYAATNAFNAGTQFTGTGTHTVNGNSTFTGAIPVGANFKLQSGNFAGTTSLTGTTAWEGGQINGDFAIPAGSQLNLAGTGTKIVRGANAVLTNDGTMAIDGTLHLQLEGRVINNATATWNGGAGGIIVDGGTTLTNAGPGVFNLNTTQSGTGVTGGGIFDNAGIVNVNAPTGFVTLIGTTFNNAGTVNLDGGTLRLGGDGNDTGTYALDANTLLDLSAGTRAASGTIGGAGAVQISGATFTATGPWNQTGALTVQSGGATFSPNTAMAPSSITLAGGAATFNAQVLDAGPLTISGGTTRFNQPLDVGGIFTMSGGIADFEATNLNGATATLSGGTLGGINGQAFRANNGLTFNGGTIAGTGNVIVTGTAAINAGAPQLSGSLTTSVLNLTGGALGIDGTGALVLNGATTSQIVNGSINNAGRVRYETPANDFLIGNGGVFNNDASGTFDIHGDLLLRGAGNGVFNNAGTLLKSGGTVPGVGGFQTTLPFNNNGGLLDSQIGALELRGGGMHTGSFRTAGNGVNLSGGTHAFAAGSSIDGPFVFLNNGATMNVAGNPTINSSLVWNGTSTITGGTLNVAPGGRLDIGGTGDRTLAGATISSRGTTIYSATGGDLLINGGSVFDNLAGGTFDFHGDTLARASAGAGTFNNAGTLTKSMGAGVGGFAGPGVSLANTGTIRVLTGTFQAPVFPVNNGTLTIDAGAVFATSGNALANAGTLRGNGVLDLGGATLTSSGTVAPGASPGRLAINGNYVQTPTGTLAIDLGGTNPGVTYDVLQVNGTAQLDGTLAVTYVNAFTPGPGDRFSFLTYSSHTGDFATFQFPVGSGIQAVPGATAYAVGLPSAFVSSASGASSIPDQEAQALNDRFIERVSEPVEEPQHKRATALTCD